MDMDTEFNNHISCPASCLGKLRKRFWKNRKLRSETKMVVDNACELSMLLHVRIRQVVNLRETNHHRSEDLEAHSGGQLER